MSLESWGIHTFEGWRGADDSLIIRYSENVHFPNSSPHHRGESWWVSHLALRCAQGEVQTPAGTQSFGLWRAPFPPFARPPPRTFPAPLTETKILSSVTYGCIINEIRICIVLRTHVGVCVFLRQPAHIHRRKHKLTEHNARERSPFPYPRRPNLRVMLCMTISRDGIENCTLHLLSCHLCFSGISWQLIWKVACFVRNV